MTGKRPAASLEQYYESVSTCQSTGYSRSSWLNEALIQRPITQFLFAYLERHVPDAGCVMEVGCGFGDPILTALRVSGARSAVINDLSSSLLEVAERRIHEQFPEVSVRSVHGDFLDADLSGLDPCDVVLCVGVLNHVRESLERFVGKLAGFTRQLAITSFSHSGFALSPLVGRDFRRQGMPFECLTAQDLRNRFERYGLRCRETSYSFGMKAISPTAVMIFERVDGRH